MNSYHQIIDANINRVSEGLRVIEDYVRFVTRKKQLTDKLSQIRKQINKTEKDTVKHLLIRNTNHDMRAAETPLVRKDTKDLLKANFKRVEEGLRVLEEYTGNSFYNICRYQIYELEKEILLSAYKKNINPGVYLISDDIKILEKGIIWKVSCIQLRDKKSSKKIVLEKAIKIAKIAKKANIPFIVNDYIDIAILSDADGLHAGQDDLEIKNIREILGSHKIIGRSTHNLKEGIKAQNDGADYVGIGPIWSTPSKSEEKEIGFDYLKKAKKYLTIPYVAIGGIDLKRMGEIKKYSPSMIALIRAYKDIPEIKKRYQKMFKS